ncbi:hypothetical protein QRX50_44755 [Amycolatopsis carbonis]|uniref:Exo-alpha-sialidase n=1 Tax=Amycolatopsis carbonis TaxID=715471 RepID=A0A9Y2IER8_9PSEU|nr:hypothetical protein [Amycolatopsis sp. 2-15]WIX78392.1 hypothetical protein QRX50_44755 [Amycolatopsis sp. 2-15]
MMAVRRLAFVIAAFALVGACSAPVKPPWRPVDLPVSGTRVLGFVRTSSGIVMTGSVPGPSGRAPAAWLNGTAVPLFPATGYGRQAELTLPAASGARLLALGSAYGGAHANPRPTIWTGSVTDGLTEHAQPVELLGGERAVTTSGSAAGPAEFVLTGQWDHRSGGVGAAVWTSADGASWALREDPALLSTASEQTRVLAAAFDGQDYVAVGDARSGLSVRPMAWTSADGSAWTRVSLPSPADSASAWRVTCSGSACDAVGVTTEQRLACWHSGPSWTTAAGGPVIPAAQLLEVTGLTLDESGHLDVAVKVAGRPRLWRVGRHCEDFAELPLPEPAASLALLADGPDLLLATTTGSASRVWRYPLPR